jgi:hypothetical protein
MKSPSVSNVRIEFGAMGSKTCLGWDAEGFRYHVWSEPENDAPWERNDGTVFKRSIEAITNKERTDRVVKTDATSRPNRTMLATVGHIARNTGVLDEARRERDQREAARLRELTRLQRKQRLCEDPSYRYDALRSMERDGDEFCRAIAVAWRLAPEQYREHLERGFCDLLEQFTTDTEAA